MAVILAREAQRRAVLVYSPHPLLPAAGRRIEDEPFLAGETIEAYLERRGIRMRGPAVVTVNGARLPAALWRRARPKPGALVAIRAGVAGGGGGGGGGKDPTRTVLTLALLAAGQVYGAELGALIGFAEGSKVGAAVGSALITVGGGVVMNALLPPPEVQPLPIGGNLVLPGLLPPPQPNLAQAQLKGIDQPSPTYALTGGSNRARPFEPLPLAMGRHRMFPDYGAKEYTEFEGDDQYLYQCFNFGFGDLTLSDFRIGSTSIDSFTDVEVQVSGASGALTLFPSAVDTADGATLDPGIDITRTSGTNATALAVDITGSLYQAAAEGLQSVEVVLRVEYRPVGGGSWTAFGGTTHAIASGSTKPLRITLRTSVASGQYEVRVTRLTEAFADTSVTASIVWSQLRSYQPDTTDYSGQNRVAVRIRASGQLNGRIDQFSALVAARTQVFEDGEWSQKETENPAWWVLYLLRGQSDAEGRTIFGAGFNDARIDLEGLKSFAEWCTARDWTFNGIIDRNMSIANALEGIARCGMGSMTVAGAGKHGVVWDAPDQPVSAVYGMGNILRDTYRLDYSTERIAEEIVVQFVNPDLDWQQDEVRATVPEIDNPQSSSTVGLWGCKYKAMAGRICNLMAADQYYHNARISWQVDMEGNVNVRGDTVLLAHDMMRTRWGYSGRLVEGSSDTVLQLDRKVAFTPDQTHYVLVKKPDGSHGIHAVVYTEGETDSLELVTPLAYDPSADADGHPVYDYVWMFDLRSTPGRRVKITDIKPAGLYRLTMTGVDDDPEYYLRETQPFTHVARTPAGANAPALSNLVATEELVRAGQGYLVRVTWTWDVLGRYDGAIVRMGLNGAPKVFVAQVQGRRYTADVPDGSTIELELTAPTAIGIVGALGRLSLTYSVLGAAAAPPADVPWLTIDGDVLAWGEVNEPDVIGYLLRFQFGARASFGDALGIEGGFVTERTKKLPHRFSQTVTIMVVAVDAAGLWSRMPAYIITDLGTPAIANIVEEIDLKAAGWPGRIIGGSVDMDGNLVADDASGLMWGPNPAANMWALGSAPMWFDTVYAQMHYLAQISPTESDAGSTLTLQTTIAGKSDIQYRRNGPSPLWSDDAEPMWGNDASLQWHVTAGELPVDFPMWTDDADALWTGDDERALWSVQYGGYQTWPGRIDVLDEPYDFYFQTAQGAVEGKISECTFTVDMPDIEESFKSVTIAATTGTRLPLTNTYRVIKAVPLTLENDGGTAVGVTIEDYHPTLGPLVKARDASRAAVAAKVSGTIQGY